MLALHARVKEISILPPVILGESMFVGLYQIPLIGGVNGLA
jgi:hypothetical protein